jgi:hypothetical protein
LKNKLIETKRLKVEESTCLIFINQNKVADLYAKHSFCLSLKIDIITGELIQKSDQNLIFKVNKNYKVTKYEFSIFFIE